MQKVGKVIRKMDFDVSDEQNTPPVSPKLTPTRALDVPHQLAKASRNTAAPGVVPKELVSEFRAIAASKKVPPPLRESEKTRRPPVSQGVLLSSTNPNSTQGDEKRLLGSNQPLSPASERGQSRECLAILAEWEAKLADPAEPVTKMGTGQEDAVDLLTSQLVLSTLRSKLNQAKRSAPTLQNMRAVLMDARANMESCASLASTKRFAEELLGRLDRQERRPEELEAWERNKRRGAEQKIPVAPPPGSFSKFVKTQLTERPIIGEHKKPKQIPTSTKLNGAPIRAQKRLLHPPEWSARPDKKNP